MIMMTPTRIPGRRRGKADSGPRQPDLLRFATLVVRLHPAPKDSAPLVPLAVAAVLAAGIILGIAWKSGGRTTIPGDELFVMEEEIPPLPPELPPPRPDPGPPLKVEARIEPPPPPRFGLEEHALGESGDLAVATGSTIMKKADSIIEPPPLPTLPAAPVFVDQAPMILAGDPPEYPARALDRGLEGTVVALITIDTNGTVSNVSIEKSAGPDFDGAVLKAARRTRFQPPIRDGRKAPARFRRPFEFGLE